MGVFKWTQVFLVIMAVGSLSWANPIKRWMVEQELQMQQLNQQSDEEPCTTEMLEVVAFKAPGGALQSAVDQQRQQKVQQKLLEALMEEKDKLIEVNELEDLAMQIGRDVLVRIIRPLRVVPTAIPIDNCVTRSVNATLQKMIGEEEEEEEPAITVPGTFTYRVCGGDDASMLRVQFQLPGQTTLPPETTTTTPAPTTVLVPTTPATLCPPFPTTAAPPEENAPEEEDVEVETTTALEIVEEEEEEEDTIVVVETTTEA